LAHPQSFHTTNSLARYWRQKRGTIKAWRANYVQRPSHSAKKIGVPRNASSPVLVSLTNFEIGILSARKLAQTNLTEGAEAKVAKEVSGFERKKWKGAARYPHHPNRFVPRLGPLFFFDLCDRSGRRKRAHHEPSQCLRQVTARHKKFGFGVG